MRSSTCEVEEEQSAPSPVLGRAGEAAAGGEAAEACVGTDTGCRREGGDARGEAAEAGGASGVGDVAADAGEEPWCVGTRSGHRARSAARTTPLAGEACWPGEGGCGGGCGLVLGEGGGRGAAVGSCSEASFVRRAKRSQSSGETAGCGSAVATCGVRGVAVRDLGLRVRGFGSRLGVRVGARWGWGWGWG